MSRPYFFWDYDLSEEDVREILAGDDEHRKAWVISRILNAARWEDIWDYLTVDDIRTHFDQLTFRLPHMRDLWARALEVWSHDEAAGDVVRESKAPYEMEPAPRLRSGILTPLQHAFMTRFFSHEIGRAFYLTGGTALAAFYLYHRFSEDLDLFTLEEGALDAAQDVVLTISEAAEWEADVRRLSPHLLRVVLTDTQDESIKVDLVQDAGPQFGEKQACDGMIVDALVDVAANKVTAILGRADAKDFVDLYFLIHELGYDPDELIELAKEKDPGLTAFYLAGMMRHIHRIQDLPVMLKPVDLETLRPFYSKLADRLLAEHEPPS